MQRFGALGICFLISATSMLLAAGCSDPAPPEMETWEAGKFDDLACLGATLDGGGYCRSPNGQFTFQRCCELELLSDCIAETEECLGHIEDEGYFGYCGDEPSGYMCVGADECPDWLFDDVRTPHEIMQIDISYQCDQVCATWMPDCMYDLGYEIELDLAAAFDTCFEEVGCRSDVCETDADLCADAQERFEDVRSTVDTDPDPDPEPEPEEWTLEQCAAETEECLGHTEDETYFDACGDEPSGTVCVNEESCPAWIFEDAEQTALEILGLDISYQCEYVCAEWLSGCMYDMGYDDGTVDEAFEQCIDEVGCPSAICDQDPDLCAQARDEFDSARS